MELAKQTTHEFGYIQDNKVFLKGYLDFPDRQIGIVKETEAAALAYFEKRFEIVKQKIADLKNLIEEAQNKGSYLMKLLHMRKYLSEYDALGDFVALFKQLDDLEVYLRDLISDNRVRNLTIKEALVAEAESLDPHMSWKDGTDKLQDIKNRWIKTGSAGDKEEELGYAFDEYIKVFLDIRKSIYKNRASEIKNRTKDYRNLIYKAENLRFSDSFEQAVGQFKEMQQAWKNIGKVPHQKAVALWEKFKNANEVFFNRYKNYKSYKEQFPEVENIQEYLTEYLKEELEKIHQNAETIEASERAKELLVEWKKFNTTFRLIDPEFAYRFRHICDRVFEISYLVRVIKRKYPLFDSKLQEEKLRIKVSYMRELVSKDKTEITKNEEILADLQKQRVSVSTQQQIRTTMNIINTQKRKLEVKKEILQELETSLQEFLKK
ncbi:MAG: DUF349 domain-containing protein [Cytophagales bacterium]|nr:MAG: DUF349 domain-containing protein [Cytophagales bacterium]